MTRSPSHRRWKSRPTRPAFPYFGSKGRLSSWIESLSGPHTLYCEPCVGSAAHLLRKPPSPIEVVNDRDDQVVNFYQVLRDPEQLGELVALLELTPYAKVEFETARATSADPAASPVERARRFFVRGWQGFGSGNASTDRSVGWARPTPRSLRSEARGWTGAILNLRAVADRMREVHVEHDDLVSVIQRYDGPATLFYIDPPYVTSTITASKPYRHNFTEADHRRMATALHGIQGMAIVSGLASPLYDDELFLGWERHERASLTGAITAGGSRVHNTEVVWLNPHAAAARPR